MNRRNLLLGGIAAFTAPLVPWQALSRALVQPGPADLPTLAHLAGVAPRQPALHPLWLKDSMRFWGRELVGERSHWCADRHGLPLDETVGAAWSCTCKWEHHYDYSMPPYPQRSNGT